MSEAEQARGPQRNEAEGAGSAGRGEDSAGGERTSGTPDAGTPATGDAAATGKPSDGGAVTDAQDGAAAGGEAASAKRGADDAADGPDDAGSGKDMTSAQTGDAAPGDRARDAASGDAARGTTRDEAGDRARGGAASGTGTSTGDAPRDAAAEAAATGRKAEAGRDPRAGRAPAGAARDADAAPAASPAAPAAPRRTGSGASAAKPDERLLAGRYRLGGVLGRGGMGTVWRAVDETLGRTVAVKELRFPNAIDEDEKRRLITRTLREAKAIARIRNNSAVTVFDVVDEDDRPWIVMELVEGKSLAEVVREDGVLTPRRAAEVGLAILDVLRSAHREGILHRDVKPSNVLIGKDGRVVLTDFGIAQVEGDPSITSTGMLVGAPSYISPERARGHKPGPAADLWSLGGLLYASVEGSPPYDKGSAIATLTAVMTEPLDPPKNAGPLTDVIYGLLAKDPAQRLDDAGARAMLTRVVNAPAEDDAAEPEPSPEQTRVIALPPTPPAPPAAPRPSPATPKDPAAADRVRGALRSVRNAAAAAKAEPRSPGRADAARTASQEPGRRPAPVRASITDVVPRRTLVVIAVVAVLAVLSTVLVLSLGDDGETGAKGSGKAGDDRKASAGASQGGDEPANGGAGSGASPDSGQEPGQDGSGGTGQEPGADGGDGADDGSSGDDGGDGGGTGGATLPEGYAMVSNDRWHFTMAMPSDFRLTGIAGQNSGGKFSVDGGVPRVQVDFNDSPKDDAAAAWAAAVAAVSASSNGYKHIGIRKTEYNGYPTVADWEFQRKERGQVVRILNRGFKVDAKRGYSIMITCRADEWDGEECETLRRTAFATFSPKD
ncbi:serine/threonine-protein kinase [Streptomyces genisteinicus]|uniref:non-specific serine/threonine protein kinase n=1 Tax=Streptomyces genisteinicus TaxID=2768068 RepID=A0A7H0HW99_9ACTN|nr:serine/threonine-protein kinase [Streptomyces genisteinicus]QNP64815.1 serine/threonine protein kinase [Streptomyces genisteinicus]